MKGAMKTAMLTATLWVIATVAHAQTLDNGNMMIDGCAAAVDPHDKTNALGQGFCLGVVTAVSGVASLYPQALGICAPRGVTNGEVARVALKYMQQHPEYLHEPFTLLTLAAMRRTWPCKGGNRTVDDPR